MNQGHKKVVCNCGNIMEVPFEDNSIILEEMSSGSKHSIISVISNGKVSRCSKCYPKVVYTCKGKNYVEMY
jgi:hypothetical protein